MSNLFSLFFYIILFFISGLFFKLYSCKNGITKGIGMFMAVLLPSFMSAIRFQVGTDYSTYDYIFTYIRNHTWREVLEANIKWEIGFKVLVKILAALGNNSFIFGVLSFSTLYITIMALKYYKKCDLSLSYTAYLFFYFWGALNIVRQSLALAIVFYAYHYIFENNKKKYFLYVILAYLIHTSAIITLPIYLMWNHKKNKVISVKLQILILSIFVIGTIMWRPILQIILESGWKFANKFTYLLNNNNGMNRDIFVKLIMLAIFLVWYQRYKRIDKCNELFIFLFIFNCIIGFTGYQITFFKRIGLYFEVPGIVLIGEVPYFFNANGSRTIIKFITTIMLCLYFVLVAYILGHGEIIPYRWR